MKRSYQLATAPGNDGTPDRRQTETRTVGVLSLLREFIEEGGFGPGTKLPPERSMAERLGVGRPAIREGLKALSILDVLESRRGDGTYIKSLEALHADQPRSGEFLTADFNMLDVLEVRKIIEPRAARLAATRANEAQLRHIERERVLLESEENNWARIGRHDFLLHNAIIEAAGNLILTQACKFLAPLLRKSREITAATATDRVTMLNDHRILVEAILSGEAGEAERAMLEHLRNVGLDLIADRKR
jgi:GntR family transcriptional regulator, transcriptional repressor for pyruvate dehydrogenase complex